MKMPGKKAMETRARAIVKAMVPKYKGWDVEIGSEKEGGGLWLVSHYEQSGKSRTKRVKLEPESTPEAT